MLAVGASDVGSGKTLLSQGISMIVTGRSPAVISYDNLEEFEKTLVMPLLAGDPVLLVDNVENHAFRSPRLCQALSTDGLVEWRNLGETRNLKILNRSLVMVTGNQLRVDGELPRRTIRCRLIPNVEFPEAREFNFDPVKRATEQFPRLVVGMLTALRYYLQAGCPKPTYGAGVPKESGSFEAWNKIVRGMLLHLGFADPLRTQREVRRENPMFQQDNQRVLALYGDFQNQRFSAGRIMKEGSEATRELFQNRDGQLGAIHIGFMLKRLQDRKLAGLQLVLMGSYGHTNDYHITGTPEGEGMPGGELF
jgi:putative DNA primase/helicase